MSLSVNTRLIIGFSTLGLLCGCHDNGNQKADAITATVQHNVQAVAAAINAHDADKAASFDALEYVGMMHGTANIIGQAADLASMKQVAADPNAHLVPGNIDVEVARSGEIAISHTAYSFSYTNPDNNEIVNEQGNWVQEWKLQPNGSWKAAWQVISDLPASTH